MCGRFTLRIPASRLVEIFSLLDVPDFSARYNIAPTQMVASIRKVGPVRELTMQRWGLIPFWAKDKKIGNRMINARSETADTKPAFRAAFKKRRCLIPADGFYEWRKSADSKTKTPYLIHMRNEEPFAFAGLWETWSAAEETVESCTILTTSPNEMMAEVHDRMPVILGEDDYDTWLDETTSKDTLTQLLKPMSAAAMAMCTVSTFVNSPRNESPECVVCVESHSDDSRASE